MTPISWHTTKDGERVFTHARPAKANIINAGIVIARGRKAVRVLLALSNGKSKAVRREYSACFPLREVLRAIEHGDVNATVEVKP